MIPSLWRVSLMTDEERSELAALVESEGRQELRVMGSHQRLFELDEAE